MKKEIFLQLQFVLMVLLTSGAFLASLWFQGGSAEMTGELLMLHLGWMVVFVVLCGVRLTYVAIFNFARLGSDTRNASSEIPATLIYGTMGSVSVFLAWPVYTFQLLLQLPSHISVNLLEMWLNFRPAMIGLLVGFNFLVLVRLAVVRFSRIEKLG